MTVTIFPAGRFKHLLGPFFFSYVLCSNAMCSGMKNDSTLVQRLLDEHSFQRTDFPTIFKAILTAVLPVAQGVLSNQDFLQVVLPFDNL
jgi:hypothetical protein